MDELSVWVVETANAHGILRNGYFSALADGRMSREVFGRTQQQFFFAVRYFSRPLAALMARMPESALRQGLIHNLMEEHGGEERATYDPPLAHDRTFWRFLETLGMAEVMQGVREGPVVRAFNTSLMGACLMERTEVAFGCLGVIEHAFAGISALIGEVVVKRGWVAAEDLVHYKLHAEIDEQHAADFFKRVAEAWSAGGEERLAVEDGVRLGLHVFDRLYLDLLTEAASSPSS
ncbi:MAG: TenA family transcriptional regulator [Prosthecobacter sp.]